MRCPIAAALLLAALPLSAEPAGGVTILPKGTPVRLRLETDLRSGRDKAGQPILFTVAENVYSQSHVLLILKGAIAHGHVTTSSGRGSFSRNGRLSFVGDYAPACDGSRVPLRFTEVAESERTEQKTLTVVEGSYTSGKVYDGYGGADVHGETYRSSVVAIGGAVDAGRLLSKGGDALASRGGLYEAVVAADAPVTAPIVSQAAQEQVFVLKDKTEIRGALVSFDGKTYAVQTAGGRQSISAAQIVSIAAAATISPR